MTLQPSKTNRTDCYTFLAKHYPPHTIVEMDLTIPVRGWMIDFADILSEKLDFCYHIFIPDTYGFKLENGTFTGLMGMLNRHEADMSLTPLAVTPYRKLAFDYSTTLFMDQQQILGKRPAPEADMTGFIKVFPGQIWAYVFGISLITCLAILLIHLGNAWVIQKRSKSENLGELSLSTSVHTAVLWTVSTLLSQSVPFDPKGSAVRMITGLWLIVTLIIGTLYKSNLKAMLILPTIELPYETIEEFTQVSTPAVNLIRGSLIYHAVMDAPEGSTLGNIRKKELVLTRPQNLLDMTFSGEVVGFSSQTAHNMIMHNDFSKTGKCHLFATNRDGYFKSISTGLPFPPGSKLMEKINPLIVGTQEFGIQDKLFQNYVFNSSECNKPISTTLTGDTLRNLELKDFYGVFLLYLGGIMAALLAFVTEKLADKHGRKM